jgi:hypothetical protein
MTRREFRPLFARRVDFNLTAIKVRPDRGRVFASRNGDLSGLEIDAAQY